MDFAFSAEQEMLRDSARRFLTERCPSAFIRRMMAHETAHDPELWSRLVEMGWPGLLVPEEYGGAGGTFLDLTVVLEEAGRALLPGPLFSVALLGPALLGEGGSPALKRELMPRIAGGSLILTLAIAEPAGRHDAGAIALRGQADGGGYVLSGEKMFVSDAHVAEQIAVVGRTAAGGAEAGITIFLVPATAPGLTITPLKTVDMTRRLCHLKFDRVAVEAGAVLGTVHEGWPLARRVLLTAAAGVCAELVGTAQRALDMAVEYAKTRTQFGKPIGSFQAIKHKCVDMLMMVENARSLTYYACWAVNERAPDAAQAVAMAKAYTSDMAKAVTSEAIQIHGGIGFTWEHDIHLFHRRALAGEASFGNAPIHRETVARGLAL